MKVNPSAVLFHSRLQFITPIAFSPLLGKDPIITQSHESTRPRRGRGLISSSHPLSRRSLSPKAQATQTRVREIIKKQTKSTTETGSSHEWERNQRQEGCNARLQGRIGRRKPQKDCFYGGAFPQAWPVSKVRRQRRGRVSGDFLPKLMGV